MGYLNIVFLTSTLVCLAVPEIYPSKKLEKEIDRILKVRNVELDEIEAEAQRAMNEANELLKFEVTRKEHPMVIAKKFDLRYDPEMEQGQANKMELQNSADQLEKGTDGHLEFELQKHKETNKHLFYDVPDKSESYHLFYDVDAKSQKTTLLPPAPKKNKAQKIPKKTLTLENALPLLEKIAQEIVSEDADEEQSRNDSPCPIDGKWISKVGGINLNLTTMPNGKINVKTSKTQVHHVGDLQGCEWHITGLVPSRRQGPFALAATCPPQHRIATFIGQCKVCSDVETVYGNWMFSRISRDCNEAMAAIDIKSDVWLRDHLEDLRSSNKREKSLGD